MLSGDAVTAGGLALCRAGGLGAAGGSELVEGAGTVCLDDSMITKRYSMYWRVAVSQQRLGRRRVAQLSAARMNEVCAALRFSLECDSSYWIRTSSPGSIDDNDFKIFPAKRDQVRQPV
jgi:hypothetical protein